MGIPHDSGFGSDAFGAERYVPAAVRKSSIARLLEVADMYPAFGSSRTHGAASRSHGNAHAGSLKKSSDQEDGRPDRGGRTSDTQGSSGLPRKADEMDGSCSTDIERAKVQLSSTARKGVTQ